MGPSNERKRLLIVDDEELLLRSLGRALRHHFDVTISSSAEEALGLAGSGECWDVVLSDINMPGMNGIELAARLAQACPALLGHIALMTGGALSRQMQSTLERNGLPLIAKPIDTGSLLVVLAAVGAEKR